MSSTPKSLCEEGLNDSWVEVSSHEERSYRTTPVSCFLGSGVEKMLLDAQRESSRASVLSSSNKSSEHGSPKTPCTPVSEDLHPGLNVLSTQSGIARRRQGSTDWIWDWSSRPDILPPKEWNLHHPAKSSFSIRNSKAAKRLLSSELLSVLIISNIITFVLGASFGIIFMFKRIGSGAVTKVLK